MFNYHYIILVLFIIFNIINLILLYNKKKYKTAIIITYIVSFSFSLFMILFTNIEYKSLIIHNFSDNIQQMNSYLDIVRDINISFLVVSFFIFILLLLLSFKLKYKLLWIITIILLLILNIVLYFWKCIIISKNIINFSMFAQCLKYYYLNILILPLLIKNLYIKNS